MRITHIAAKEILDSRGKPTIEVEMRGSGFSAVASVPSGKSVGSREALEFRDERGSVLPAIKNIEEIIAPAIVGKDFASAKEIDELLLDLDGTENKSRLGANATLAVSIAAARLFAQAEGKELWRYVAEASGLEASIPHLYMNVINGGVHADFNLPFQEYMVVPFYETMEESYKEAKKFLEILGERLREEYGEVPLGDEGGYAPQMERIEAPFELLTKIIEERSFDMKIAIDAAASELYASENSSEFSDARIDAETNTPSKKRKYKILGEYVTAEKLLDIYAKLTEKFPLFSIEDPFEERDEKHFRALTEAIGENALIVGDDFTVTNPRIIEVRAKVRAANAVIIKPNQIGTLSEVYEAARAARAAGWKIICSHRSGETMDSAIADIAVGLGAYGIKAGSLLQKERKVKYERLLEIEKEIGIPH